MARRLSATVIVAPAHQPPSALKPPEPWFRSVLMGHRRGSSGTELINNASFVGRGRGFRALGGARSNSLQRRFISRPLCLSPDSQILFSWRVISCGLSELFATLVFIDGNDLYSYLQRQIATRTVAQRILLLPLSLLWVDLRPTSSSRCVLLQWFNENKQTVSDALLPVNSTIAKDCCLIQSWRL